MDELKLKVSRLIPAEPKKVYAAWLDPKMLARFMLPGPGTSVPKAETDPKVGGRFALTMRAGDQDIPHAGTYRELVPDKRIVFTWESPFSTDGSTVTVDLAPAEGGTRVTLTHVRFASEESRTNHENGWAAILQKLEREAA